MQFIVYCANITLKYKPKLESSNFQIVYST